MNSEPTTTSEILIDELNDLIVKNYDASKGFQNAADHVHNASLKRMFADAAVQRSQFAEKLQMEVSKLGGTPKSEASPLSNSQRNWMDIKSAFSSNNDETVLEATVTEEKAAIDEYDELLEQPMPNYLRMALQTQRSEVNNNLQLMRALEEVAT